MTTPRGVRRLFPLSGCGVMRKTNKLRIKYQTITALLCVRVKPILLGPANLSKGLVLTGENVHPFLMKCTHLEKCGCGFV